MNTVASQISRQLGTLKVLVIDDEPSMRKVTRALLQAIGVRDVYEANDGLTGLEAICTRAPDIVLLDWEMPAMNGPEFVRTVRSPGRFPLPDVPIIMLTGHCERWRVVEAMRLGVNEFLLKPVSSAAVRARIVAILAKPRPMVKQGEYYGPAPRKPASFKPDCGADMNQIVLVN